MFENVRITSQSPHTKRFLIFVEKSEVIDARYLGAPVTFKYSHDNAKEGKAQSSFQAGFTKSTTFNFALKATEPTSGIGSEVGFSRTATATKNTMRIQESNESEKDQVSFDVAFPHGSLYLLSTLHLIRRESYTDYHMQANMTIEIEYVEEKSAKSTYKFLTTKDCFDSVFLTPGVGGKLTHITMTGDIDTASAKQKSWILYGPYAKDLTDGQDDSCVSARKFVKAIPKVPTFLDRIMTSLSLIKKIGAAPLETVQVKDMFLGIPLTDSLATKIAGYT
jgi:hypothetical protein